MDLRKRIEYVLDRLGLHSKERLETVLALLDDETPSRFPFLASAGLPFAAGATTRHLLDYIALRLRKGRMDRELRDYIMLPLREVGVLVRGYADSGTATVTPSYWKPKSPNNLYLVDPEFRDLVMLTNDRRFRQRFEKWLRESERRITRVASSEAAAAASEDSNRLVTIALEQYCEKFLSDYEIVFVDNEDGARISKRFEAAVEHLQLPLNLSTRWPDVILNIPGTNRCWIVDCVETDGEIDPVRKSEIEEAFAKSGLSIEGFTTVYRTVRRFAERQAGVDNLAPSTYVWIAEIGGAHFLKESIVDT